jgi:signal recognition particle receptor subunit beta
VPQIDFREKQLTIKLVYYGPPRSGKTTNLQRIHGLVDHDNRGRLVTLDTKDDRTLFFDLLPVFFRTSGLSFRLKVYTVPGQPMHDATRRIVLKQADGVVFVADSDPGSAAANRESFENLLVNLQKVGLERSKVPIVVQYNKRDLPNAVADDEMRPLEPGQRVFPATALAGEGVMDTFYGLLEETWRAVDKNAGLHQHFGIEESAFMGAVRKQLDAAIAANGQPK